MAALAGDIFRPVPLIPTLYGTLVEHSDADVRAAEQRMRSCLERLATPSCPKAQQTVDKIAGLWSGRDGTKSMRGVRVLPTPEAVRCVAKLVRHQPPAVRAAVFSALDYTREVVAEASDEIILGLRDETPAVRITAARLLIWIRPSEPLVVAVRETLADPVWSLRWLAIRALATWKAAPSEELAAALLSAVPTTLKHVDDWLYAADAVDPMPVELERRRGELRARRAE
jgi:hypothetical protein